MLINIKIAKFDGIFRFNSGFITSGPGCQALKRFSAKTSSFALTIQTQMIIALFSFSQHPILLDGQLMVIFILLPH